MTHAAPESNESNFKTPCPTPKGGWQVLDPSLTTDETFAETTSAAESVDGYATMGVSTPQGGPGGRDPLNTVVSVYVAGDVEAAEAKLRKHWGGMLCVTKVEHSHADLEEVQRALMDVLGAMMWGGGNAANQVELTVFNDDGSIQQWADQEFGEGLVVVHSILQPAS